MSDASESSAAVMPVEAEEETASSPRHKRGPLFNVILWNDDDHTAEYVIEMMMSLFAHSYEQSVRIAETVDKEGKAIVLTTHKELAELKRDQIHAYGKDGHITDGSSLGSMYATIETAPA